MPRLKPLSCRLLPLLLNFQKTFKLVQKSRKGWSSANFHTFCFMKWVQFMIFFILGSNRVKWELVLQPYHFKIAKWFFLGQKSWKSRLSCSMRFWQLWHDSCNCECLNNSYARGFPQWIHKLSDLAHSSLFQTLKH